MELGMIGLGKMGAKMTERLLKGGHQVVVHDQDPARVGSVAALGATPSDSVEDLVSRLRTPRTVWVMVPAGEPTEAVVTALAGLLSPGDTVIDGGNSNYKDSSRRSNTLRDQGLDFVDVGTSGGVWGLDEGHSMLVGGEREVVDRLRPLFETLAPAPDKGWGYVGPSGAGHFVKMIHNGIEYGLMQAYAEGFEILKAKEDFDLDLHQIAEIWRHGSVVRSWLLDLTAAALAEDQNLGDVKGWAGGLNAAAAGYVAATSMLKSWAVDG